MRVLLLALWVGCGGAQARLDYGGAPAALQQLHEEGWLAAFHEGSCLPLLPEQDLPAEPPPLSAAERDADDTRQTTLEAEFDRTTANPRSSTDAATQTLEVRQLGRIAGGLLEEDARRSRGRRSPECRAAARRLQTLQREYRTARRTRSYK